MGAEVEATSIGTLDYHHPFARDEQRWSQT